MIKENIQNREEKKCSQGGKMINSKITSKNKMLFFGPCEPYAYFPKNTGISLCGCLTDACLWVLDRIACTLTGP